MIQKLRRKFILMIMAASALILAAVFVVLVVSTQSSLSATTDEILQASLDAGEHGGQHPPQGDFPGEPPEWMNQQDSGEDAGQAPDFPQEDRAFFKKDDEAFVTRNERGGIRRTLGFTALLTDQGEVELEDQAGAFFRDLEENDLVALVEQAAAQGEQGTLSDYSLRYAARKTDRGTLVAFADTSQEQESLYQLVKNCLIVGLIALLAVFLGSIFLSRWAVRPVEEAWNHQKRFVGDASHELKTPLTVILSNADMILSHPGEDVSRWAENIKAEGSRMKELTQELLTLARSDDGSSRPLFEEVDLSYLLTDTVLSFEPVAFENERELLYDDIAPDVRLPGDRSALAQLCGILVDNALKYSSPGGKIWVRLQGQKNSARLCVENEGEPIAPEDLERIFQRFYRADPSRHGEGHGLGLAIAQRVAQQHRGKIWAESEGGINRFIVQLPLGKK